MIPYEEENKGYEHLVEKELNHRSISVAECREWIANKKCEYGSLGKGKEGIYSTNNKVNEDYPNRFTSFFTSKRYYKENCVIIETKVYSHFNQSRPSNVLADMSECKYQDGSCQPGKMNEIMIWDVNKDQNCQYISIGKLDGTMNNGLWINSQNQIALDLKGNKIIRDCNIDLLISEEGFAVKEIQNIQKLPTPQALTTAGLPSLQEMSIKSEIPRSEGLMNRPQKYQKEREEYYKRQQEIQNQKDKETRDKYEADRKEFEKRREEKMKQYLEFEKRKKEKLERQRLLNTGPNTTTTSVNSNKIKDSEIQRIDTTKRVKRSTNQSLEEPFPLPTYEEYSKIKNDCLLLPSFEDYLKTKDLEISDFVKTRDACDTFPTYDEYVTKFAKYALEELENRKSKNTETFGNQRIGRTRRQVYSDFQAAGEFQYLENKSNNLLRHTAEVINEHRRSLVVD
uniref:Uncharacterized protein n=1 Tax=Caenorhabditis japonica TaxID=281687 RepID=A0A8R1I341_CAEJA